MSRKIERLIAWIPGRGGSEEGELKIFIAGEKLSGKY